MPIQNHPPPPPQKSNDPPLKSRDLFAGGGGGAQDCVIQTFVKFPDFVFSQFCKTGSQTWPLY